MANTISIGELRQNPTRMLREVKAGATYTITDHGEPIAEVAPIRGPRWVPISVVNELLREFGGDEAWAQEIDDLRKAEPANDPWERAE